MVRKTNSEKTTDHDYKGAEREEEKSTDFPLGWNRFNLGYLFTGGSRPLVAGTGFVQLAPRHRHAYAGICLRNIRYLALSS